MPWENTGFHRLIHASKKAGIPLFFWDFRPLQDFFGL